MKRFKLLLLVAVLIGFVFLQIYYAPETITPDQAAKFIGQQKTVCGTVASTDFAATSKGQPTFLNLDKPDPNQVFTVLIWGCDRGKFEKRPEEMYAGKNICVSGTVTSYQDKPQIVVKTQSQIKPM